MTTLAAPRRLRAPVVDMARRRRQILNGALFALLTMTLVGPYITFKPAPFTGEGSPLRQMLYIGIYGAVLFAVRVADRPRRVLVLPLSLTLVLGYCALSLFWAIDPDIAMRRLVLTTIIMLTIFTMLENMGYAAALAVTRALMIVALAVNYFFVLAVPSIGIHQAADLLDLELIGNWRGLLMQKNFTGALCAFTILAFLFDARRVSPLLRVGMLIATGFFLYMTKSKTSMGLLAIAIGAALVYRVYNPRYRALILPALALLAATIYGLVVIYWAEITAPFADPRSLTGRVQIWPTVLAYWRDNWLLGSGYGSFWNIGSASPIYQYTTAKSWVRDITSGHNGYIDVIVQIGLPGLLLVIACMIVIPFGKLLASTTIDRRSGSLIVAFLVFCWLHNSTESSILDRDQIVQVFLMLGLAMAEVAGRAPATDRAPLADRASAAEAGRARAGGTALPARA